MAKREDAILKWLVPVELRPRRVRRRWLLLLDFLTAALVAFSLWVVLHAARESDRGSSSSLVIMALHPLMYAAAVLMTRHNLACDEIVSLSADKAVKRLGWPRRSILDFARIVTAGVFPHRQGRGRRELVFLMVDGVTWRSVLPPCLEDDVLDGLLAQMNLPVPLQRGNEPLERMGRFRERPLFVWPRLLGAGPPGQGGEAAWALGACGLTMALVLIGACMYGPYTALPAGLVAMALLTGAYSLGYMKPRVKVYPSGVEVRGVRVPWTSMRDVRIDRDEEGGRVLVVEYDLHGVEAVRRIELHWRFDEKGLRRAMEQVRAGGTASEAAGSGAAPA